MSVNKQALTDAVITEIQDNLEAGDTTALDCMLMGLQDIPGVQEHMLDFLSVDDARKIRGTKE